MEITIKTENKKIYDILLKVVKGLRVDFSTADEKVNYEKAFKGKNPLKGTLLKYEDPFEQACDDWEVLK